MTEASARQLPDLLAQRPIGWDRHSGIHQLVNVGKDATVRRKSEDCAIDEPIILPPEDVLAQVDYGPQQEHIGIDPGAQGTPEPAVTKEIGEQRRTTALVKEDLIAWHDL